MVGACRPGMQTCVTGHWAGCLGGVDPATEICNSIDDDCDGDHRRRLRLHRGRHPILLQRPGGDVGRRGLQAGDADVHRHRRRGGVGDLPGRGAAGARDSATASTTTATARPTTAFRRRSRSSIPRGQNRDADILFMIDDSRSMELNQASLIANFPILMNTLRAFPGGLPNLHVAVVTSDLGAAQETAIRRLHAGRQGRHLPDVAGRLHGADRIVHRRVEQRGDQRTTRARLMTRSPASRTSERPAAASSTSWRRRRWRSASMARFQRRTPASCARTRSSPSPSSPTRTTARRRRTPTLFDSSSFLQSSRWGRRSFRCNEFGHLCGGVAPPRNGTTPVTITADCHSNETAACCTRWARSPASSSR